MVTQHAEKQRQSEPLDHLNMNTLCNFRNSDCIVTHSPRSNIRNSSGATTTLQDYSFLLILLLLMVINQFNNQCLLMCKKKPYTYKLNYFILISNWILWPLADGATTTY